MSKSSCTISSVLLKDFNLASITTAMIHITAHVIWREWGYSTRAKLSRLMHEREYVTFLYPRTPTNPFQWANNDRRYTLLTLFSSKLESIHCGYWVCGHLRLIVLGHTHRESEDTSKALSDTSEAGYLLTGPLVAYDGL